jgi:signal transduction histidine kinase
MLAQNLSARYFDDDPQGRREVDKIINYVQEAAQHVSDLQRGVMPVQVDRDGLAQALRELTSRIERLPHVDCTYEHDGATDVSDHEVKLQLYRIAQEATRNALSHANPSHVHVELRGTDDAVILRVSDDGCGFDLSNMDQQTASSLGLHSMRYRAQTIGARFDIEAPAGEGTTVTVTMPRSPRQRHTA